MKSYEGLPIGSLRITTDWSKKLYILFRGVGIGGSGSAAAPQTFWGGEAVFPGSWSMWQTVGGDYLQVAVTSVRSFLLCTKLTKLVGFYDVAGVVLVSLLLS